jgi:hypothetical protein
MQYFRIKNLEKFQYYKKRNPPWIRLYTDLLNAEDVDYTCLTDVQKLHLIHIWMLATRHNNRIPMNTDWLQRRLNVSEKVDLEPLFKAGFIEVCGDACNKHAGCLQLGDPETETETETETGTDPPLIPPCGGSEAAAPSATRSEHKAHDELEALKTAWNASAERLGLPRVTRWSEGRKRHALRRLKDAAWRSDYPSALERMAESRFCCGKVRGRNGGKSFRGHIDWFLRPDTVSRLVEGFYSDEKVSGCVYEREGEALPI